MKYDFITINYKDEKDLVLQLNRLTESGCTIIQIVQMYRKEIFTSRELNDMEFNGATVLVEKPIQPIQPTNQRYPMCDDQPAQIDCRVSSCRYYGGSGKCTNISPAIKLNDDMKKVKVKDLKPGDVLATSGFVVNANLGLSFNNPGHQLIVIENGSQIIHKFWKPNTTVSILDK